MQHGGICPPVPPTCDASRVVGVSTFDSALWDKYYQLYGDYVRCVGYGRGGRGGCEGGVGSRLVTVGCDEGENAVGVGRLGADRGARCQRCAQCSVVFYGHCGQCEVSVDNEKGRFLVGGVSDAGARRGGDVDSCGRVYGDGELDVSSGRFSGEKCASESVVSVDGCHEEGAAAVGVQSGCGANTQRNREWRKQKKEKKNRRKQSGKPRGAGASVWQSSFSDAQRCELAESRAARFKAENELAVKRAQQQLAVVSSLDVDVMKKRRQTQLVKDTEVNKVQIEKAFGTLSLTGNVPGVHGSVHTVATGSVPSLNSGSISPNSSVSMHEIHEMQKENLSLKVVAEKVDRVKDMAPDLYQIWFGEKKTMTVDTGYTCENGMPVALKGDPDLVGYIDGNKRFHYGPDPNYEEYDLDNY